MLVFYKMCDVCQGFFFIYVFIAVQEIVEWQIKRQNIIKHNKKVKHVIIISKQCWIWPQSKAASRHMFQAVFPHICSFLIFIFMIPQHLRHFSVPLYAGHIHTLSLIISTWQNCWKSILHLVFHIISTAGVNHCNICS